MEPIHGTGVLFSLKVEDEFFPILCAVEMTLECSQEVLLATTAGTGIWRQKRLRQLSEWFMDVSGLSKIDNTDGQISFFYLLQENIRGSEQIIQAMYEDDMGNTQVLTGTVLIPTLRFSANVGSFADASVRFEGAGAMEIEDIISDVESGVCEELESDTWIMAEGEDSVTGLGNEGRSFAGKEILDVARDGISHDYTSGTPGNREYAYNGVTISFDPTNPAAADQTVYVEWKQ